MDKTQLENLLGISQKRQRLAELAPQMSEPSFWADREKAARVSTEYAALERAIAEFEQASTPAELERLELKATLAGPHDASNAYIAVHAGAGGTEAQDWAGMLKRMYERFAQNQGWQIEQISETLGEEAGVKSTTLAIRGPASGALVYGTLKGEAGVHRLVRISPFDSDRARHTSFALVEIVPELPEEGEVELDAKELKIETFRASGHGGQNVNKVETAVRVTHLPTGLTASSQNERSQAQNRSRSLAVLKGKLIALLEAERREKIEQLRGQHLAAAWGNQIRSYVLHPYKLVKDLRTGVESREPQVVLDGQLSAFIEGYLRWSAKRTFTPLSGVVRSK